MAYTGQEYLEHTQLYHYNGRLGVYPDFFGKPISCRMLSPDKIVANPRNGQNYNRYSYVLNNPLKYTDPTGWVAYQTQKPVEAVGGQVAYDAPPRIFLDGLEISAFAASGFLDGRGGGGGSSSTGRVSVEDSRVTFKAVYRGTSLLGINYQTSLGQSRGTARNNFSSIDAGIISNSGNLDVRPEGLSGYIKNELGVFGVYDYSVPYDVSATDFEYTRGDLQRDLGGSSLNRKDQSGGGLLSPSQSAYTTVIGGMVSTLGNSYTYQAKHYAVTAAEKLSATKAASGLKLVGRGFTGLSIAAAGYEFYNSDKSGADYARLAGAGVITVTAFIPFVGPLISIGLGAADAYGAFDGIYEYFDE